MTQTNTCLKCCQEQDVFLFGWDIKVGGVLKRLPDYSNSSPTKFESGVLNNQPKQLSGVSFKDVSASSNFESKTEFKKKNNKKGTNKVQLQRPRNDFAEKNVTALTRVAVCSPFFTYPTMPDNHTCFVSFYYIQPR